MKFWPNLALSLVFLFSTGCFKGSTEDSKVDSKTLPPPLKSGLIKGEIKPGKGIAVTTGKFVEVHYEGWIYDKNAKNNKGKKFDSSRNRKQPFSFRTGAKTVIPGWEEGVLGMKAGEQIQLIVPPRLAYGERGIGEVIPPNSTLIFEIELLKIK